MKKIPLLLLIMTVVLVSLLCGCDKEKSSGSIYGIVTDKATGEPIRTAGVELLGIETIITGSDGQFSFANLHPRNYTMHITRLGYSDLTKRDITVESGDNKNIDIQLEKLPPALRIVDDNRRDIEYLDFGSITGDDSRLFNIFNDGNITLDWQITIFSDWLSVNKDHGSLESGNSVGVIAYIDRGNLYEGENQTSIHITSNNGSRQISAIAFTGEIYTSSVSEVTENSADFNAIIHHMNNPYTERGFLYSTTVQTPTLNTNDIQKIVVQGIELGKFSTRVSGLASGQTYYVRAYMKKDNQISYGNVVSFTTEPPAEYVTIPLAKIMVQNKDLGYTTRSAAITMCNNSTLGGFKDWRLPTVEECRIIYNCKQMLDGIDSAYYWTSDIEAVYGHSSLYCIFQFGRGYESCQDKVNEISNYFVRAVRSIN